MSVLNTSSVQSFEPGPDNQRALRNALGTFGTGVTIVTTMGTNGPCGITANSFSGVSLDPALVLWCVDIGSDRTSVFAEASHSVIHILSHDQAKIALAFARDGDAFDKVSWTENAEGVPVLDGCVSHFECAAFANHDGGDHRILVSRVLRASTSNGDPLLFKAGKFGRFGQDA